MGKYSKALCDKIAALVEEDNYNVTEICKMIGVSRNMFYHWKATKPMFAKALDEAVEARQERLLQNARKAMRNKLNGRRQIETKTTYVIPKEGDETSPLVVKEYVVKEKYIQPEISAVIHSLDSQNKQQANHVEVKNEPDPLNIIVDSEKAKQELELMVHNLRNE